MNSIRTDAKKRCQSCLKYVNIHITCFKCDAVYHIYCWKKVSGAYVNEIGQLFCCGDLTSTYGLTDASLGTQDNPSEIVIEKGNVNDYKEDLGNRLIKEEDSEWNVFKSDACLLEFTKKEHLENHYSKRPNKLGELIQELNKDKGLENCLHKEENFEWNEFKCDACLLEFRSKENLEAHYKDSCNANGVEFIQELNEDKADLSCSSYNEENVQKESCEQPIRPCDVESSCLLLYKDNDTCITDMKRDYPAHRDDTKKKCKCADCNNKTKLVNHKPTHANEKPFKCDTCEYATAHKSCLKKHILTKHSNAEKKYKCTDCKYSAHDETSLVIHKRVHTRERPFKCDTCGYAAAQKSDLKRHILIKHSNPEKRYKCADCKYSTHDNRCLVNHKQLHTNEKPFKCNICEYAAAQRSTLSTHILRKHFNAEKQYKCSHCEYSTHGKLCLQKHERTHTNERPYKCDMCDYATAEKPALSWHILGTHSEAEKKYRCTDCKYSAYDRQSLVDHKCIHTKERPFKCGTCEYAATEKRVLNTHILVKHSNAEKRHKCGYCEYSTHIRACLLIHERTHTKEKPFKCDICNYAAIDKRTLRYHIFRKHSDVEKFTSVGIVNFQL